MTEEPRSAIAERAESLRRQEELSREALSVPGLTRSQRRIHSTRLQQVTRDSGLLQRGVAAAAAGWVPFQPSPDWFAGFIEDPRFLAGRVRLMSLAVSVPVSVLIAWLLLLRNPADALAALAGGTIVGLGLFSVLYQLLGQLADRRQARLLDCLSRISARAENQDIRVFNAPMPARTATALRLATDSRLFDQLVVCSPREADFRQVSRTEAPSLGLLDPVLVGVIGDETFLIAQWDLADDLTAAS